MADAEQILPGGQVVAASVHYLQSAAVPSPFPDPSQPEQPPFDSIPNPPNVSVEQWQASFYDATSHEPAGRFVKRPSGPADLHTGRLTGETFTNDSPWKQT